MKLSCAVDGSGLKKVLWIRTNADGATRLLNSTLIDIKESLAVAFSSLSDSPPEDKFPYRYQCLAIGRCDKEVKSNYKTVDLLSSITK